MICALLSSGLFYLIPKWKCEDLFLQDVNGALVVKEDANAFQVKKDQDGFEEAL